MTNPNFTIKELAMILIMVKTELQKDPPTLPMEVAIRETYIKELTELHDKIKIALKPTKEV